MRNAWATIIICEGCGTQVTVKTPEDTANTWQQPPPPGWYSSSDLTTWRLLDPFGRIIGDLCPECSALPLNDLLQHITEYDKRRGS